MNLDPSPRLATLAQRARAIAAAGGERDAAVVAEVMAQVNAIAEDTALAPTRELGAGLNDAASALTGLAEPQAVERVFNHAQRVLQASGDTRIDDLVVLWNNLGALYDRYGAAKHRDQMLAQIAQVAQSYDGPLHEYGVNVFLDQAMIWRRQGRPELMLTMLRQAHRWRMREEALSEDRGSWLEIYATLLLEAGRSDEAAPVLAEGLALARELGQSAREAELLNLSATAAYARGDIAAALALIEPARKIIDEPALAETPLACTVLRNLVVVLLGLRDPSRYAQATIDNERAIVTLNKLGRGDGAAMAQLMYHRGALLDHAGDWRSAAPAYRAAAASSGASPQDARDWISYAGRAWFEAGEFDAASECYLDAVRLRVAGAAPA